MIYYKELATVTISVLMIASSFCADADVDIKRIKKSFKPDVIIQNGQGDKLTLCLDAKVDYTEVQLIKVMREHKEKYRETIVVQVIGDANFGRAWLFVGNMLNSNIAECVDVAYYANVDTPIKYMAISQVSLKPAP